MLLRNKRFGIMKLSIIIVNFNVKYFVEQCLESIERALGGIDYEIYVADNHSTDNSVEYLKPRFPKVNFIECNHNLGFAKANNIAIRQCVGEYVMLLNPDTFVGEDTIKEALDFMDSNNKIGALGLKMYNVDGTLAKESRRGVPTPSTAFYKMTGLCARYPQSHVFGKYYMGYLSWDSPARIDIVSGACCIMRRKTLESVGLLDEDYFMYGEDIDLSYRMLKNGYENWYMPLPILHYKGESTHKSSFKYVHVFYQAMLIFFRKHFGNRRFYITLPIKFAIYFRAFIALVNMISENIKKSLGFSHIMSTDKTYVFIGTKTMLDSCKHIAKRKGLNSLYYEVNEELLNKGHNALELSKKDSIIVVYDKNTYSFKDMLGLMSLNPRQNISLGTYSEKTGLIITHNEVLK